MIFRPVRLLVFAALVGIAVVVAIVSLRDVQRGAASSVATTQVFEGEDELRQTGADQFALYHQQIRTKDGDDKPAYGPNYQIAELKKARLTAKRSFRQIPWVEHGPSNVGGRTRAIIVDSEDPSGDTWIAASVSGGIWRTQDAGASWSHLTPELPNLAFSSLVQAASNPDILYAGSGEGFFNGDASVGAGVFKSLDKGQTWQQLPSTAQDQDFRYVNRIVVSPVDPLLVVVATRSGMARTTDGGASWLFAHLSTDATGNLQVIADPSDFSTMYAHDAAVGVIRSLDAGVSWETAATGLEGLDGFEEGAVTDIPRIELAVAPTNPNRLYAMIESDDGGERFFMSTNKAATWVELEMSGGLPKTDIARDQGWYDLALAVHPDDENILFAGGINLYRITLDGEITTGTLTSFEEINTSSFLSFTSFSTAGHFDGVLRTGATEEASGTTSSDFTTVEIRFGAGVGQKAHRFIPPDGPGIPFADYPYANYVDVPFEVWDTTNNRQLMVSFRDRLSDGEFNLIPANAQQTGREYIIIHAIEYDASGPHQSIGIDGGPVFKMLYFVWPIGADDSVWNPSALPTSTVRINFEKAPSLLRTVQQISLGSSVHADQHIILPVKNVDTGNVSIVVGTDGGVFVSRTAGVTWESQGRGYNTSQFYGVDKAPGLNRYIGGTQDNGTRLSTTNPTAASGWASKIGGDGFEVAWNQEDVGFVIGASQYNRFRRSTDGGVSFSSATSGLGDIGPEGGGQFLTTVARSHEEPFTIFTIGESGVWKSKNFGGSWSLRAIPQNDWDFGGSGKVRVSLARSAIVWAGYEMDPLDNGIDDNLGKLHVSTDFGDTFSAVPTPVDLSAGRISGLATHPLLPSTAFVLFSAARSPKVLRTDDLGQTWHDISGFAGSIDGTSLNGFPDVAVHDLLVIPDRHFEIWAATGIGLFISKDNGASWSIADNGLPAVSIWRMRVVDDRILMATHGRGVWTVDLAQSVAIEENIAEKTLPGDFELQQNYPNPFSSETTISFSIPSPDAVRLRIVDIQGRVVSTLLDENLPAGMHDRTFYATGLASGTYFYQLHTGTRSETKKMIVVR